MKIPNYKKWVECEISPKLLKAMKEAGERMMKEARGTWDIPKSLLTMYGWTGIWNSLNTVQKMRVFRFVYKVETAEEI